MKTTPRKSVWAGIRFVVTHPTLSDLRTTQYRTFRSLLRGLGHARQRCRTERHCIELIKWKITEDKGITFRSPTMEEYHAIMDYIRFPEEAE